MSPIPVKPVQEIIDAVVASIDAYNTGLANCQPTSDEFYVALFMFTFAVVFLIRTSGKKLGESWLRHIAESIVIAAICICLFHGIHVTKDTPTTIHRDPLAAARYGCLHNSKPISLRPLFNDKKVLTHATTQRTEDWQQVVIRDTIALLRSLSIENYYANNCTCVC